ncbi:hypothetical protein PybrP1_004769, partial [[Pythium] brassicae (nom. inval.)]
ATDDGTGATDDGTGATDDGTTGGADDVGTGDNTAGMGDNTAGTGTDDEGMGDNTAGTGTDDEGMAATGDDVGTGAVDDGTGATDDGTGAVDDGTGATDDGTGATDDGTGATDDGTTGGADDVGTGDNTAGTGTGTDITTGGTVGTGGGTGDKITRDVEDKGDLASRAAAAAATMKLLLARAARAAVAGSSQTRALSSFREQAVRVVTSKLRSDLESNPNLWLSAGAVDEPTVSILDPARGYAIANDTHANGHADFERLAASDVAIKYLTTDKELLADPFVLVREEMTDINGSIKRILGSDHPVLSAVARYFFEHDGGKKVRPTMVLLVAHAAEAHRAAVGSPLPEYQSVEFTLASQQRIAEITEMIHTASLLHDDVIDEADTRRGLATVNKVFGAKLAILAGDFLLARSSVCLARLRNFEAVELMSTAIEHLVKGEVMQMKNADGRDGITPFEYYLRKNYYKTGSLMSNSCKAALELGKHETHVTDLGFAYGRHMGLAFQLIDDVLDYQGHQSGKPLLADLKSGLATAPLLLAQEEFPVLRELAARKFSKDGDIELASELVEQSTGIEKSRVLAVGQAELACQAAMQFAPSPARDALAALLGHRGANSSNVTPSTASPQPLSLLSARVGVNALRGARFVQTSASASAPPPSSSSAAAKSRSPKVHGGSVQSFATAATAVEDDERDDSYLFGERSDEWFTTDRSPRYDAGFPGLCAETRTLHSVAMPNLKTCSREEMLDYLDNTWALTDVLFSTLQGDEAFTTPPPHQLRHPLIFYYGHPTVFYVNKFVVSGLFEAPVNAHFEHIFEVGVDEMRWDDMSKNEMEWPSVADVTEYRREVYAKVRALVASHPGLAPGHAPIDASNDLWALCMALEHERIHLETSSMLMLEHPVQFFRKSSLLPPYHASAQRTASAKRPVAGVDYPVNELLAVPGGRVVVGKPRDFPTFGWDNEYGHRELDVPACHASKFLVSNGEFFEFVRSGGYLEPSHWSPLGWDWRCFRNTKWPQFWVPDGPSGSHQYSLRALFDVLPMQWDWPAQVNLHEAQAFCKWKNARDGNRDAVVYHLTTEPIHQLLRDAKDRSADASSDDILTVQGAMATAAGKNLNVSYTSFSPVDAMAPTAAGFHDVFGNAWEWCEDFFAALPGFQLHAYYDDFSAPCFDGEHHVIMGGSFISSGDNGASKFARYHFRPHFFQHAGFRLVAQPVDPDAQTIRLVTTDVHSPGPFTTTNRFRTSEFVAVAATAGAATGSVADSGDYQLLFQEIHNRAERVLESFMQRVGAADARTLLVRGGVDGARRLKEQVKPGHTMVVLSRDAADAAAVVDALAADFALVDSAAVPVFVKESETDGRLSVQRAAAWTKK